MVSSMKTMSTHRVGILRTATISLRDGLVGAAFGSVSFLSSSFCSAGTQKAYTRSMPRPNAEPTQKLISGLMLNRKPAHSATMA